MKSLEQLDRWIADKIKGWTHKVAGGQHPRALLEVRRDILDEVRDRIKPAGGGRSLLPASPAEQIAGYMRGVVTSGRGRAPASGTIPIAGKTGTAELANSPSHAWFVAFAPDTSTAPIAGDIVLAARQLGII